MSRVLLAAAILLSAAGCTRYWAKPGGTGAELEAAKANCETTSLARFPPELQLVRSSPGDIAPLTTNCVPGPNGPHCVTAGGVLVSPSYATIDLNRPARRNAWEACMMAGGWRQAKDKAEAEAITRQDRADAPRSEGAMRGARAYCETIFRRQPLAAMIGVSQDAFDRCVTARARQLDGS